MSAQKCLDIVARLEGTRSRNEKQNILQIAIDEGLEEFFEAAEYCYNGLRTFGVSGLWEEGGAGSHQEATWAEFKELLDTLAKRELTGNAAVEALKEFRRRCNQDIWDNWFHRVLARDLRCGAAPATINKVLAGSVYEKYTIGDFGCMLAKDGGEGFKLHQTSIVETKLDGIRALAFLNKENGTAEIFSRNGKELDNFAKVQRELEEKVLPKLKQSVILDGEMMSSSYQDLMKQAHRKVDVETDDCVYHVFDVITKAFWDGKEEALDLVARKSALGQLLDGEFESVQAVPYKFVANQEDLEAEMQAAVDSGHEGLMIKDPDAEYVFGRSSAWLKQKPTISVTLKVISYAEGTGKHIGKLGALICRGRDSGVDIECSVGGGFTDEQRDELWRNAESLIGQLVEVKADKLTIAQNSDKVWSLRFPRFVCFRSDEDGNKI